MFCRKPQVDLQGAGEQQAALQLAAAAQAEQEHNYYQQQQLQAPAAVPPNLAHLMQQLVSAQAHQVRAPAVSRDN